MKMSILKSGLLLFTLFATVALTSCKKDDDNNSAAELKENIVGIWDVTSFKLNGFELMGTVVDSASIEYKMFTGAKGDFAQEVKYLDEDPRETTEGKYEILSGDSVKMSADGDTYNVKITISGNQLQLEGEQDGEPLVLKAKKRN